jgi:hypothetical protein
MEQSARNNEGLEWSHRDAIFQSYGDLLATTQYHICIQQVVLAMSKMEMREARETSHLGKEGSAEAGPCI